jgi:hypothetical protein
MTLIGDRPRLSKLVGSKHFSELAGSGSRPYQEFQNVVGSLPRAGAALADRTYNEDRAAMGSQGRLRTVLFHELCPLAWRSAQAIFMLQMQQNQFTLETMKHSHYSFAVYLSTEFHAVFKLLLSCLCERSIMPFDNLHTAVS